MKLKLLALLILLPSCSVTVDPITGKPIFGVDSKSVLILTDQAVKVLNEK